MSDSELEIIIISLRSSLLAIFLILPLGIIVSWIITRTNFKLNFVLELISSLPLALPPVVTGYFLLWLLGSNSFIGNYIQSLFNYNLSFTWIATVFAAAIVSFPLVVRSFILAFQSVDTELEKCARGLGASNLKIFISITLPLSLKGIMAGLLLGFGRAFSEFGATIVVAGNIPGETSTIPLAIYTNIIVGAPGTDTRLIIISIVIAIITLGIHNNLSRFGSYRKA